MARRKSGVLCDPMDRPDAVSDVADCDPKKPNRRADAAQRRRFFEPAGVGSDRDELGDTQQRRPLAGPVDGARDSSISRTASMA